MDNKEARLSIGRDERVDIRLAKPLKQKLDILADKDRILLSVLIRRALMEYIASRRGEL